MKKIAIKITCTFVFMLICFSQVFAMQVFVKMDNGKNVTLELESSDTIEQVKQKLIDKEQIEPIEVILSYEGTTLQEGRTLADYNVNKEDTLLAIIILNTENEITVLDSQNGKVITNYTKASEGEQISIKTTPNEGYRTKDVLIYKTGDKNTIVKLIDNTFAMPGYAVTIEAKFEKVIKPVLDNTPTTGGMKSECIFSGIMLIISGIGMIITYKKIISQK